MSKSVLVAPVSQCTVRLAKLRSNIVDLVRLFVLVLTIYTYLAEGRQRRLRMDNHGAGNSRPCCFVNWLSLMSSMGTFPHSPHH